MNFQNNIPNQPQQNMHLNYPLQNKNANINYNTLSGNTNLVTQQKFQNMNSNEFLKIFSNTISPANDNMNNIHTNNLYQNPNANNNANFNGNNFNKPNNIGFAPISVNPQISPPNYRNNIPGIPENNFISKAYVNSTNNFNNRYNN